MGCGQRGDAEDPICCDKHAFLPDGDLSLVGQVLEWFLVSEGKGESQYSALATDLSLWPGSIKHVGMEASQAQGDQEQADKIHCGILADQHLEAPALGRGAKARLCFVCPRHRAESCALRTAPVNRRGLWE